MTAPYKTEAEIDHFNRFNRYPDAECWLHGCAFENEPEAAAARANAELRILTEVQERAAQGSVPDRAAIVALERQRWLDAWRAWLPTDGRKTPTYSDFTTPRERSAQEVARLYPKVTVEYPLMLGIDWSRDAIGEALECLARGLLALARMGAS